MDIPEPSFDSATIIVKQRIDEANGMTAFAELPKVEPLISSFFGINDPNTHDALKMGEIYNWAVDMAGTDEAKILEILRDVRFRIAKSDINSIHNYLRLHRIARSFRIEAEAMEK